jgi:hypothetical protein
VAVWPDRPGIARNSSKRVKGAWALIPIVLASGAVVFALGALRVAPLVVEHPRQVGVRMAGPT